MAIALNYPDYWRQRAEESRALGKQISDKTAKQAMFSIADDCEKLAARASLRLNDERNNQRRRAQGKLSRPRKPGDGKARLINWEMVSASRAF